MFYVASEPARKSGDSLRQPSALRAWAGKQRSHHELAAVALERYVVDLSATHLVGSDQLMVEQAQADVDFVAAHQPDPMFVISISGIAASAITMIKAK